MAGARREATTIELSAQVWRRRRGLALAAFLLCAVAGLGHVVALPDLYRASATVLVARGDIPLAVLRAAGGDDSEPRLDAVTQQVLSRPALEALIERHDLYPRLRASAAPEAVLERMRKDIVLERRSAARQWGAGQTVALELHYQGWVPQAVAAVANELAEAIVAAERDDSVKQAAAALQVMDAELAASAQRLDEQARAIAAHEGAHPGGQPERRAAAGAALDRLRQQLHENQLQQQRAQTDAERRASAEEGRRLRAELAEQERRAAQMPRREQELAALVREHAASRAAHAALVERHQDAQVAAELAVRQGGRFRIVEAALPPVEPSGPNRLRLGVLVMLLAGAAAAFVVFIAEELDGSFHSADQLRGVTGIPVLARIPRIDSRGERLRQRLRTAAALLALGAGCTALAQATYALGRHNEQLVWLLAQRGA